MLIATCPNDREWKILYRHILYCSLRNIEKAFYVSSDLLRVLKEKKEINTFFGIENHHVDPRGGREKYTITLSPFRTRCR